MLKNLLLFLSGILLTSCLQAAFRTDKLYVSSIVFSTDGSTQTVAPAVGDFIPNSSTYSAKQFNISSGTFRNGFTAPAISVLAVPNDMAAPNGITATTSASPLGSCNQVYDSGVSRAVYFYSYKDYPTGRVYSVDYSSLTVSIPDGEYAQYSWTASTSSVDGYRVVEYTNESFSYQIGQSISASPACADDLIAVYGTNYDASITTMPYFSDYYPQTINSISAGGPIQGNKIKGNKITSGNGNKKFVRASIDAASGVVLENNCEGDAFSTTCSPGAIYFDLLPSGAGRTLIQANNPDTEEQKILMWHDYGPEDNLYIGGMTIRVSSPTYVHDRVYFQSKTSAQILATTPAAVGDIIYCNNCSNTAICVSTGTVIGSYSRAASRTGACN